MTKSTDLTKEQLFDAYSSLGSISAVARLFEVSQDTVRRKLKKYEIDFNSAPRKFNCNHGFFSADTEETFYWAGFLAANGSIARETGGRNSYRISINTAIKDKDHLQNLKRALQSEAPVKELTINKDTKPYATARFLVSSKQMVMDLAHRFNVVPRKTFIYSVPPRVESHALSRHFFRGWVDGKGTFFVDHTTNKLTYFRTSGTFDFLKSFMKGLNREARVAVRDIKEGSVNMGHKLGSIVYSSEDDLIAIANFLYGDAHIFIQRKRDAAFGKRTSDEEE